MQREQFGRRTMWGGFFASALLHLLVVWFAGGFRVQARPFIRPLVETVPAPDALIVVEIAPTFPETGNEDPRPEPRPPELEEERLREEPEETELDEDEEIELPGVPGVDVPGISSEVLEGERVTNASRLRLRFSDSRIWFDPRDPMLIGERLARFARADSAVRAILRDWLDSLRLSEEQRRRATDWTFEKDGERWGVSPQGIHLGEITIPIPIGFAPTGPQRRAFEQAIRDLTAIQLQDLRADLEAVADERREAMRARSEEEVQRRRGTDTLRSNLPP